MSPQPTNNGDSKSASLRRILNLTSVLLGFEAAGILAFLIWGLAQGQFRLFSADLTLIALFLMAAIWIGFAAWKIRGGARWARSSAIFWQAAQLLLGYDSVTGRGANWLIGGTLAVSGVLVLALLFSKPVIAAAREEIGGR